jgi:serine acetyltransferase
VGAGAVVIKNVPAGMCVIGVPARPYCKYAVLS